MPVQDRLVRLSAAADALRRAGCARAGATSAEPAVISYLTKVREHAFRVIDSDVGALRALGMSDDAIFDVTVAAAVGAADERLARALALLDLDEAD